MGILKFIIGAIFLWLLWSVTLQSGTLIFWIIMVLAWWFTSQIMKLRVTVLNWIVILLVSVPVTGWGLANIIARTISFLAGS